MGVGRRMKKQGPPEPLGEAHFTNLKRKAGMSVWESRAESEKYSKKRRTSKGREGMKNSSPQKSAKGSFANGLLLQRSAKREAKKPESVPLPMSEDEMGEDSDAADLMDDESDPVRGLEEESGERSEDNLLGSGSEVYDSDQDHHPNTLFSEDEDESDAEE